MFPVTASSGMGTGQEGMAAVVVVVVVVTTEAVAPGPVIDALSPEETVGVAAVVEAQ